MLEGKRQAHARIGKIGAQITVERTPGTQQGQKPEHVWSQDITPPQEGGFETRSEARQLGTVVSEETPQRCSIRRGKPGNFLLHTSDVGGSIDLSASSKDQPILRIEPYEVDFLGQVVPCSGINLGEYAWIQKERRTKVKAKPVCCKGRRPPTHARQPFEDFDLYTSLCQQYRGCQPSCTRPDNDHTVRHDIYLCPVQM
jgi:hypothetical protein